MEEFVSHVQVLTNIVINVQLLMCVLNVCLIMFLIIEKIEFLNIFILNSTFIIVYAMQIVQL